MTTRFPKRVTRQIFLPVNRLEISENDGAMRIGFKRHVTGLTSKTRNPSMERIPRHIVSTSGNSGMDHSQKAIPSLNSLIWGSKRQKHCAFCHWSNTKQELIDDGVSRQIHPFSIQAAVLSWRFLEASLGMIIEWKVTPIIGFLISQRYLGAFSYPSPLCKAIGKGQNNATLLRWPI